MIRIKSAPPDRRPRTPKLKLPPGACDTHLHIYGPQDRFPLSPKRRLEVEDCTLDDVLSLQQALGLSRGLIVQSFQHGHSYEYMLHALSREPDRFRGVAAPAADITDAELAVLTKAGVIAARYSPRISPDLDLKMVHRLHDLGWQAHFMLQGEQHVAAWRERILAVPGKFVIEHMAAPAPEKGIDSIEFRFVRECIDTGRCWVKLSQRFTKMDAFPFADTLPFIHLLVEQAPERLLWGSDWPHPGYEKITPDDAELVDLTAIWIPDEAARNRIFADNPAELFGFGRARA
jgi:predicted TIM-barrel fold metal-dependent hydrolase